MPNTSDKGSDLKQSTCNMSGYNHKSSDTKSALRRTLTRQRLTLPPQEHTQKARALQQALTRLAYFRHGHRIAFYWPFQGEIDPLPALTLALKLGKRCYLPVLHPNQNKQLLFLEYRLGDPLRLNRYGIKEPHLGHRESLPPWLLNVVFVPLLGFDKKGHRLGKGGGYYDRTFAFLKNQSSSQAAPSQPSLVGLAYDFQKIDALPYEPWDLSLNAVVTETGLIELAPKS